MNRPLRQLLVFLAALAFISAGSAMALAAPAGRATDTDFPATASFTAYDSVWLATGSLTQKWVTLATGGTVTFGYPEGKDFHNADFFNSDLKPSSCTQTAGAHSGQVSPLPPTPEAVGWSGTCEFDTAGTYTFICDAHDFMRGTIYVGVEPPTGPTGPSGLTWPTGTPGSPTTGPGGSSSPTRPRLSVARRQQGGVVRGTVTTPVAGSRIVVSAFVSSKLLAKPARQVRVGSETKRSKSTGKASFAVKLNAAARRALHRRHRLVVSLRIVVTPPGGKAVPTKATVTVRDR